MVREAENEAGEGTGPVCIELAAQAPGSQTPNHLMKLPHTRWGLWRWFCLRGAGFPFSMLEQMAVPACAEAADGVLSAENEAEEYKQAFATAIRKQMDIAEDNLRRRKLADLLAALKKGKNAGPQDAGLEQVRVQFHAACDRRQQARERFQQVFASALAEISEKVRLVSSDKRLREAMLLQNPRAARVSWAGLQGREPGANRDKKERQRQELIANYLQRYCAKNDSIGFFGPVGWGRLVDGNLSVKPGRSLVVSPNIYFEHWAIDALAEKLAKDPRMRRWIAPRLRPDVCLQETGLTLADGAQMALSPQERIILTKCDGRTTARQIALDLSSMPSDGKPTEEDLFQILDGLVTREVITWTLQVPVVLHSEQVLRNLLEQVKDEPLAAEMLEPLDQLEGARDDVLRSLGNPDLVDAALARLDMVFTNLTGKAATRHEGWNYSGRTIFYQDCRRDLEIEIGIEVIERLGPPLSLLLTSARWFTYEGAKLYREATQKIYKELAEQSGSPTIELASFWRKARRLFAFPGSTFFSKLLPEFQRRWGEVLQITDGRQAHYTSASLRNRVEKAFYAPGPGWPQARFHSPDVMISAASVDDIRRGKYHFVLGEIHLGSNSVRPSWAMSQHPQPDEMFEAISRDLPEPEVLFVQPKSFNRYSARGRLVLTPDKSYLVEIQEDSLSWRPSARTLPISAFVIEPGPTGLIARTKDGSLKLELLELFGEAMSIQSVNYMNPIGPRPHIPRLTIDDLVIQRESWSFAASDLPFANGKDEMERFLSARRWQKQHRMPRLVFVRVPVELKPFYVDFDSPIYVENLAKMVKRTLAQEIPLREKPVKVVEMLPSSEQLWLPDAQGNKYTCELRIVASDMQHEQANS